MVLVVMILGVMVMMNFSGFVIFRANVNQHCLLLLRVRVLQSQGVTAGLNVARP